MELQTIVQSPGLFHISEQIFGYLDNPTLAICRQVCQGWKCIIDEFWLLRRLGRFKRKLTVSQFMNEALLEEDWALLFRYIETSKNLGTMVWDTMKNIVPLLDKCFDEMKSGRFNDLDLAPLHLAVWSANEEFILLVLSMFNDFSQQHTFSRKYTPLHLACKLGNQDVVKLLMEFAVEKKININARERFGLTPFHILCEGCEESNIDLVLLFLELSEEIGLDFNSKDIDGMTPIHTACEQGTTEVIQILLDKDLDFNVVDHYGRTPFHVACKDGRIDTIKLLLEYVDIKNLDVNATSINGTTALHLATTSESDSAYETVKLLLQRSNELGLNVHVQDRCGFTAKCLTKSKEIANLFNSYE